MSPDRRGLDWRLIVHPPADGAWNMAVDEAILEGYASGRGPSTPTLRLYGWRPAALSLGRGQPTSPDLETLRRENVELVRRPTGGAAVLHEHERTYSVVARLREAPFPGGVLETYRAVARALALALGRMGLGVQVAEPARGAARGTSASCFARLSAHEISVGGRKLVGSAQLRRSGAFLQHGSILLRADHARWMRVLGQDEPVGRLPDLTEALGPGAEERLDRAIVASFEETFEMRLLDGALSDEERNRAHWLRAWKYLSTAWTLQGENPCDAAPRETRARGSA